MKISIESTKGKPVSVNFNPSITISDFKHIRLLQCTLFNSWHNITPANNVLRHQVSRGGHKTKILEPGNYNIETLNEAIDLPNITFTKSKPTGRVKLNLSKDWEVEFDYEKNFASLLGFGEKRLSKSQEGPKPANFLTVSQYVVHCDAIDKAKNYVTSGEDEWLEGNPSDYLETLPVRETREISEKVVYDIKNPTNMPLKSDGAGVLSSMKIWITDQNGKSVDFHGYPYSLCIELTS